MNRGANLTARYSIDLLSVVNQNPKQMPKTTMTHMRCIIYHMVPYKSIISSDVMRDGCDRLKHSLICFWKDTRDSVQIT